VPADGWKRKTIAERMGQRAEKAVNETNLLKSRAWRGFSVSSEFARKKREPQRGGEKEKKNVLV